MNMKETVILTQLYKSPSPEFIMATCHLRDSEDGDGFKCKIDLSKSEKEQLWQYVSGKWAGLTAEIEFSDVNSNGTPKEAIIKQISGFTPVKF